MICFGIGHDATDQMCVDCPYEYDCIGFAKSRFEKVQLRQARIDFVPPRLEEYAEVKTEDPELTDLSGMYERCYRRVFGKGRVPDNIMRLRGITFTVAKQAKAAGCSVRMFILSLMWGHFKTNPSQVFYATMLLGETAVGRAELWRRACVKKYGTFDARSLARLLELEDPDQGFAERFSLSEQMYGAWIVSSVARRGASGIEAFFSWRESELDKFWLAIEPNYFEIVLEPQLEKFTGSLIQQRTRYAVSQARRELLRDKPRAAAAFKFREVAVRESIGKILATYGCTDADLFLASPITDATELWRRIGAAIHQLACLRFAKGDPTMLRAVSTANSDLKPVVL